MRAVETELKDLTGEFGNPRRDLLAQIRGETGALAGVADSTRRVILNSRIEAGADQMHAQRQAITARRQQNTANKSKARRDGIPTVTVGDDDQSRRALELMREGSRALADETSTPEEKKYEHTPQNHRRTDVAESLHEQPGIC